MGKIYLLFILLLLAAGRCAWAQQNDTPLAGVVQTEAGQPLPGATVFVKGTYVGGSTNEEGQFALKVSFARTPVVLSVSFVGYEVQEIPLETPATDLQIVLKPSTVLNQVVVAASRVEENIGQVPVTVEKVTQRQVEQLTTADPVAGLARFRGVDVSASSLLISSFSTRGFNSSRAERVLQLADYMDTQLPSLSSNFGNLLGMPTLDIGSMEILHGPASALYGANAFNGVLLFNSKDPFLEPGLTVRLRGGNRDFLDGQFRYAQRIGQRVAFKISGGYLTAREFIADNQDPSTGIASEANNNAPGTGLGYDAVNSYGDVNTGYTFAPVLINPLTRQPYRDANNQPIPTPAALVGKSLFLPGYTEAQLLADDNKAYSLKVAPSLGVLLSNSVKLSLDYKFAQADAIFQGAARYRFKNSGTHQGRVELRGRDWFVRAFSTRDFSGNPNGSYNLGFLGGLLANQPVAPGLPVTYGQRFVGTYLGALAAGANPTAAYQTASGTMLQPGTEAFDAARARLVQDASVNPTTGQAQGARLVLKSYLNDVSAQKSFALGFVDLTAGAAYRQFLLGSDRTVFDEPADGSRILNYEYGGYAQATKNLLNDRLRLSAAARIDRFKNFGTAVSPRGSVVYSAGADKQHNFRASYSRAFRSPAQQDQYIRFDLTRAIYLGNVGNGFDGYSTAALRPGANPAQLQVRVDPLRLEEVNTFEGGYRAQLSKQLYLDANYYYSIFNDFLGAQTFVGNTDGTRPAPAALSTTNVPGSNVRVILAYTNVRQEVRTQGASLGLGYTVNEGLNVAANYSFNDFVTQDLPADFLTFFNTPRHKFNFGLDGRLLERKLSYNVNYRWADAFRYESTFAIGDVPTTQVVDAQLGYTLPRLHTTLQAGVTNLFDATNYQVYGAPSLGRLGYFGLLFDLK